MTRRKLSLRIGESESFNFKWVVLSSIVLIVGFMLAKAFVNRPPAGRSTGLGQTMIWR